ncbi:MAG: translation initiation factor IF-2 [Nitrospira sp.]|nr:translation initiation factor IF-2 [Candidatus Manganitrophaceae bacterium]HIL34228.1 translation initiation factor IF-2 [Candidatus Manganitrophaceae bacterium]
MRVFELAKQLDTTSKALLASLKKKGIKVSNHMSALTDQDVKAILDKQGKGGKPAQKKTTRKTKKAKAAKVVEPPPPPKKTRVLIKKKVVPQDAPSPVIDAVSEVPEAISVTPTSDAPTEILPEPPAPSPDIALSPEIAEVKTEEKKPTLSEQPKTASISPPVIQQKAPTGIEKGTTEKQPDKEKKKGKRPGQKEEKGGLFDKAKENPKRKKKGAWAGPGQSPAAGSPKATKWQDFKPIHRKDERRASRRGGGAVVDASKPRKKDIKIYEGLTVKEFSELTGQKASLIIAKLMELGKMSTVNQPIGLDEAALIAESLEIKAELVSEKTEEEILGQNISYDPSELRHRPPVITIMGHVDHGKTSLLDAIRQTKVTEGEHGGITQHIGAYTVTVNKKQVTFLDTPGHEAFTAMRSRGAKITDIVILVVAADDGVMPQTVEAINHAKAANVPIIVATNKIDLPDAKPDHVKNALSEYDLIPEEWGGKTIFVDVSAKEKTGLDHLLEMVLLQSEVLELKANPKKPPVGTIIEAKIDKGRGPVATVLVQEGTLKIGGIFVTGTQRGKVRALISDTGEKVTEAGPSTPVEVIGLDGVPQAGDTFVVVSEERTAKEVANDRAHRQRTIELSKIRRTTLDDLYEELKGGVVKELKLIIKTDVQGSAEALKQSLEKLATDAVRLQVIHRGVGGINESDVLLAAASNAIVIGFNIRPESKAQDLARKEKVDVRFYTIIYEVTDDIRRAMEGLLEPTLEERILGQIEVRQVFTISKQGTIAGGYVKEGTVSRDSAGARVIRDSTVIFDGKILSLRRFKDDVKEVQTGYECGIAIENFNDIEVDDIIEVYTFDKIPAKL